MISAKELRIGNWVNYTARPDIIQIQVDANEIKDIDRLNGKYHSLIPLTPEILEACGLGKDTIDNPFFSGYAIQIGRGREISVSNPGTPNEFVFITELNDDKTRNVIVLRNYDYDGKTYLHHLQNIYHSFTLKELVYQPIKELT